MLNQYYYISISVAYIQVARTSTILDMTTVLHAKLHGKFVEIRNSFERKKFHGTNPRSKLFWDNYANGDNVRSRIQFKRENYFQHLKIWYFVENRLIHFYINITRIIRPIKQSKMSFSKFLPQIRCLILL